ncbi:FAD:protein FMN transferase [candidate division KSB1 bacterium]
MLYRENIYHKNFAAMGTRFELVLIGISPEYSQKIYNLIEKEVLRIELKLTRFSHTSVISELNQNAGEMPVSVDNEVIEIVELCKKYTDLTLGSFDITLLPLTLFWQIKTADQNMQEWEYNEKISEILKITGMSNVDIDPSNNTIFLRYPGMGIDLGGFGKGYALERVRKILVSNAIENAFISFGESSVLGLGHHPYGDSWKVGIQNLFDVNKSAYTFSIIDSALSTSGISGPINQRCFSGKSHIIDIDTGRPVKNLETVSVKSYSPVKAEVLSTALFAADSKKRKKILKNFTGCEAVEIRYTEDDRNINIISLNN